LVGRGRAEVGLYRVVPYVIFNIDVPVIYAVTGDAVLVSVYFASRLIPFTLVDVVRNTFRYLTARLVGGYRAGYAVGYGRAALLLVLPIPVYTLANPVHVLTLLRPEYSWAYRVLQVFSVESVFLLLAIALENVGAGVALRGARHVEMSKALYKRLATASLTYLLLTASTVLWSDTEARIYWWTAATVVYTVLYSIVVSWWLWTIEPQARRELAETYARITAYIILLAPLAYLLGPHTRPYTSFFKELITILPGATVFYAGALIIIAALDARVREAVRELLSGLTRRRTAVMSSL
ncbi:MAG: hypothetical protein F7C35_07960, partial [Desulfurococcales archaeon]|nr:hypothetical protein [Desulfurococcales archaeon]